MEPTPFELGITREMAREDVIKKIQSMNIKGECFTDVTKEELKDYEEGSEILR